MKRVFVFLLAILVTTLTLVACQQSETPVDPSEDEPEDITTDPDTDSGKDNGSIDETVGFVPTPQRQRDAYEIVTADGYDGGPYLVKTVYDTEQTLIANVIVTPETYGVDPTGIEDSTLGIQRALEDCRAMGGGVVFLPEGQYVVSKTLRIGEGVVLQGDWQDPNLTDAPEYGTVILAKMAPLSGDEVLDPAADPLFLMLRENNSNNGLCGLTVYYPEQNINDVKPYGYTVYASNPSMTTLRDLTFINAYRGIGAGLDSADHELLHIESIRMTALISAYQAENSSEIGYTYDFSVSPRYWECAADAFRCADGDALQAFCRENTVAMIFKDLDLNQYTGIAIDGCYTAMLIDQGFWGVFYDVNISDCDYGVVAKSLTGASGVGIACATIEADVYAVANYAVGGSTLKLTDVQATGKGGIQTAKGAYTMIDNEADLSGYDAEYGTYQKPADILYIADVAEYEGQHEDAALAIQAALDSAAATGGIVYVPHGVYHLYSPLTVPAGVELRGGMAMAARDSSLSTGTIPGTLFLSYLDDGDFISLHQSAGVQGLRIFYVPYDATTALELLQSGDDVINSCVAVRGSGDNVYATNMVISGCFVGIDFTDCDNHLIKNTFGCAFRHFVRAGGEDGNISAVLSNMTFTMRQPFFKRGMYDLDYCNEENWKIHSDERNSYGFETIRDKVVRVYCDAFYIVDARNETLNNVFMYGCHSVLVADHSEVIGINLTDDWQGICPMFVAKDNSRVACFNPVRTVGSSHRCDDTSSLELYNRLFGMYPNEPNYRSSVASAMGLKDNMGGEPIDSLTLLNCDNVAGTQYVSLNTDPDLIKQGSGSFVVSGDRSKWLTAAFDPVDTAKLGDEQKYLHMWIWIDDPHDMKWMGKITLETADGVYCSWGTTQSIVNEGWNEVLLPIPDSESHPVFTSLTITADHSSLGEYPTVYLDDIYICTVLAYDEARFQETAEIEEYEEKVITIGIAPTRIILNNCDTLDGLAANLNGIATINRNPAYVKEGTGSIRIDYKNTLVIYQQSFLPTDAEAYQHFGYLHMWIYVEDVAEFQKGGQIELTSSGMCDVGEKNWNYSSITQKGWNEIYLPLASAGASGSPAFDATCVNYLRMFLNKQAGPMTIYIDDIYLCNLIGADYDEEHTYQAGYQGNDSGGGLPILHNCDTDKRIQNATLNIDPTYIKEGDGSLRSALSGSVRMVYSMPVALDITEYMDGYLDMWIYVEDISAIYYGQIELTSGGNCDQQEAGWSLGKYVTQSGWNHVRLALRYPDSTTGGVFDPKSFNYFRIYNVWIDDSKPCAMYIDDIRFVAGEQDAPTDSEPEREGVLLDGENETRVLEAKAQRNATYVKQGGYSVQTTTTNEMRLVYKFEARDMSAYKDGYLHMWIYVSDFENIKGGEIELTSAGIWDTEETSWKVVDYIKSDGWNELYLPLSAATSAAADLSRINFLRVFTTYHTAPTAAIITYFDDISFVMSK